MDSRPNRKDTIIDIPYNQDRIFETRKYPKEDNLGNKKGNSWLEVGKHRDSYYSEDEVKKPVQLNSHRGGVRDLPYIEDRFQGDADNSSNNYEEPKKDSKKM
ncbi:unnamed protein product, partial [Meganyctiphanes norvegica]